MLVATFGPTSTWAGTVVTREGETFTAGDHGVITSAELMERDRAGELVWGGDVVRRWVASLAPQVPLEATEAVPPSVEALPLPVAPQAAPEATPSPPPPVTGESLRCAACGTVVGPQVAACPTCGATRFGAATDPAVRPSSQAAVLLACPVCSHPVSAQATACPHCGHPLAVRSTVATFTMPQAMAVSDRARRAAGGAWFALLGGVLIVAGSLLPWMQASVLGANVDRNGMQLGAHMGFSVAGLVTLFLGLVTGLIGLSGVAGFVMPRYIQRSAIITGVVAGGVVLLNLGAMQHYVQTVRAASTLASANLGYGLWLLLLGCALAVIGGLVLRANRETVP